MRYGLRSHSKRKWMASGHRPACPTKIVYKYQYLYQAIQPHTGKSFSFFASDMSKECFSLFLEDFTAEHPNCLLILDGAGSHKSQIARTFKKIELKHLPAYCPELNPVERFFQEMRKHTANQIFDCIGKMETIIKWEIRKFRQNPRKLTKLTLFPYIRQNYKGD